VRSQGDKPCSGPRLVDSEAMMMKYFTDALAKSGFLKSDLDYHLIRASMVIVFLFFGYQKWFEYEAQVLIP
jgi:uncharacterized membrane protein YkgB